MTAFSITTKPEWLTSHQGLLEIIQHHMFLPKDPGMLTNLSDASGFVKGLKQFLFWKGQLLSSCQKNTIFLAFLGQQGLVFKNVANVVKALRPICNLGFLSETYTGANLNFLALSFSENSPICDIVNNFSFFEGCVVLPIVHRGDNTHRFRLLWLPPMFDVARVHHLLGQYSIQHRLKRESISIGEGQYSPTNVVAGTITLKEDTSVHQLPHLIKLPTPHKGSALLYIEGRPPLCLKCREVGHTRRLCPMVRCSICQVVHFPSSACGVSSYSSVAAKGITITNNEDWLAHLDEESSIRPPVSIINDNSAPDSLVTSHHQVEPLVPSATPLEPSSFTSDFISSPTSKKCDRTSSISAGRTFLTDASDSSPGIDLSAGLPVNSTDLEHPSVPAINNVALDNSNKFSLPSISFHDSQLEPSTLPLRSRSRKKRFLSSSDCHSNSLRSEMVSFVPHSSSINITNSPSDFITSHFKESSAFATANDDSMYSSSSDVGDTLSDLEVDLSTREATQDVSSRKRKSAGVVPSNGSFSSDGDSSEASPLFVNISSPSSSLSAKPILDSSVFHENHEVLLSDEDKSIASRLSLSTSEFISLKAVCPGQEISFSTFKKLNLLHMHSIPVIQVIDHTEFFSLTSTAISKRIKTLERTSTSPLILTDLLQMGFRFDVLDGLPVFTPTPGTFSDDPFDLNP